MAGFKATWVDVRGIKQPLTYDFGNVAADEVDTVNLPAGHDIVRVGVSFELKDSGASADTNAINYIKFYLDNGQEYKIGNDLNDPEESEDAPGWLIGFKIDYGFYRSD